MVPSGQSVALGVSVGVGGAFNILSLAVWGLQVLFRMCVFPSYQKQGNTDCLFSASRKTSHWILQSVALVKLLVLN